MRLRFTFSSCAAVLAAISLGGCADGKSTAPDAQTTPDARPAAFDLAASADRLPILLGTSATVDVTVTRHPGFTGEITVTPSGLPAGTTAGPVTIAADQTTATLTVAAGAMAPHSLPTTVTLHGTSGDMAADRPVTVTVYGPPGSLDTSFGGGRVIVPVGASDDYGYAVAVQPDGKILIAGRAAEHLGDFAVIRLDRDGALDTSFGGGGKVTTDIAGGADTAYAIAVQPDGKIVVAGSARASGATGDDFALVRYEANGAPDETFGSHGKVITALGNDADAVHALVVQPDGKIVAGGSTNQGAATGVDFALARYTATGALDGDFGVGGKVITAMKASTATDAINALALEQVDGEARIVAAGGDGDFAVARYRPSGALDLNFGASGKVLALFGSVIGAAHAVAVTGDGKLVVAGQREEDFALVRLGSDGKLDTTFGDHGRVVTAIDSANSDEAQALAIEADGKLVVAGWAYEGNSTSGNFALVRYTVDGAIDASFGGGVVVTQVASGTRRDQAMAVALQSDPRVPTVRVVVAGNASVANSDFAVVRYWR